jgi:hypothetical protein
VDARDTQIRRVNLIRSGTIGLRDCYDVKVTAVRTGTYRNSFRRKTEASILGSKRNRSTNRATKDAVV